MVSEDREEKQEESEDRRKETPQLPASIIQCIIITYFKPAAFLYFHKLSQ